MSREFSPALEQLIQRKLASGQYQSEEHLLVEALESLDDSEADLAAIRDGLDSVRNGEPGVSVDEAFRRLRDRHGIQD